MTNIIPIAPPGTLVVIEKTPTEVDDWQIDWSARDLGTDTITSSTWTITGTDVLTNAQAPSFTSTTATVWLSGGVAESTYMLTNEAVTAGGRTLDESVIVRCIPFRMIRN